MKRFFLVLLVAFGLCFPMGLFGKDQTSRENLIKSLTRKMKTGAPLELEELEIRAKLYEPQVIYILDRAQIEVGFKDEEVTFSDRIIHPIIKNRF